MDATITVQRKSSFIAMLRPFTVKVDGKKMGSVKNGKECSFVVPPGPHEVEIKGALWAKSQIIKIDAQSGQTLNFECGIMTKYVAPLFVGSFLVFLLRNLAKIFEQNPLIALVVLAILAAFVIYAFVVSFRRNMMYYLERLN